MFAISTLFFALSTPAAAQPAQADTHQMDRVAVIFSDDGTRTRMDGTWFSVSDGTLVLVRATPTADDEVDAWAADGSTEDIGIRIVGSTDTTWLYDATITEVSEDATGLQMLRIEGSTDSGPQWDLSTGADV